MASIEDRLEFSNLVQVHDRVRACLVSHAMAVMAGGADADPNHRLLAMDVLASPDALLPRFLYAVSYGATEIVDMFLDAGKSIGEVPDSEFETLIEQLWDIMAQVGAAQRGPALGSLPGMLAPRNA